MLFFALECWHRPLLRATALIGIGIERPRILVHPWVMLSERAMRIAAWTEGVLIFLTGSGMVALGVLWARLDSLLAPGESPELVRARVIAGLFTLTVPVVILLFLTNFRSRLAALLEGPKAHTLARDCARYVWYLMMVLALLILAITAVRVWASFQDINFKT